MLKRRPEKHYKWQDNPDRIPNKIQYWRRKKGFTNIEFAKILRDQLGKKISKCNLSFWESGREFVTPEVIEVMCVILDIKPSDLYEKKHLELVFVEKLPH